MSEKVFKITLKVDLQCSQCNKKIKKTLCKLQDGKEKIQKVEYDEKKDTVTISGPFDPQKLIKKICCKARKVIQDIQIVEDKPAPPQTPPPKPAPPPPAPPPPACRCPCPCPCPCSCPCRRRCSCPCPCPCPCPYRRRCSCPCPCPCSCPVPICTAGPGCCCRCCSCGCVYGPGCKGPQPPHVVFGYGGPCYYGPKTCEFICEEQPAMCAIM